MPWLNRTLIESKRVAVLLSELPPEMNIGDVIRETLLDERPASAGGAQQSGAKDGGAGAASKVRARWVGAQQRRHCSCSLLRWLLASSVSCVVLRRCGSPQRHHLTTVPPLVHLPPQETIGKM